MYFEGGFCYLIMATAVNNSSEVSQNTGAGGKAAGYKFMPTS